MPGETPSSQVWPGSLERKHEVSEKRVRNVLLVAAAAWFLLIVSLLVCAVVMRGLTRSRPLQNMQLLGLVSAPNLKPLERFTKPGVDIDDDHAERVALEAAQDAQLNSYGWVDRSNGIVRIPIARAMELLLQRGLPTRTNAASQNDNSALQLIQIIPKQK
ncbi:MAG TPA: hypothetical protein VL970_10195 [Candidatus Acidoferrales bacterium]|nr:hypothetical protein [Candidatus Acidoferrales bacterium]